MRPKGQGWILLLVLALLAAVAGWYYFRSHARPAAAPGRDRLAVTPAEPLPFVPIQDGKTVDFSSGKPVVRDTPQEKAIIDSAVKEMDAATKGLTFSPTAPLEPATKKAEPAVTPPKP